MNKVEFLEPLKKKVIIEFINVNKEYKTGELYTTALDNVSFKIYEGEIVIFLGTSGAGKSTALNVLGGLDTVTSGNIYFEDDDITQYSLKEMLNYRRDKIGFVFQFYNLIQTLSVLDNVKLVSDLTKNKGYDPEFLLEKVGLKDSLKKFPSQLSGGEQQRVSIARALAKKPRILLADEPTGALDYETTKQVLSLLVEVCKKEKITLIIVTHNNFIVPIADVVYTFRSGQIISVEKNDKPISVEELEW